MGPIDAVVQGQALNSFGLQANNGVVSGIALLTFGFIVPCPDIWGPADDTITTVWTSSDTSNSIEVCSD